MSRIANPNKSSANTGANSRFNKRKKSDANQDIVFEEETIVSRNRSGFAGQRIFKMDPKKRKSQRGASSISSGPQRVAGRVNTEPPKRSQFRLAGESQNKSTQFENEDDFNFNFTTYLRYGIIILILIGLGFLMFTQLRTISKEL